MSSANSTNRYCHPLNRNIGLQPNCTFNRWSQCDPSNNRFCMSSFEVRQVYVLWVGILTACWGRMHHVNMNAYFSSLLQSRGISFPIEWVSEGVNGDSITPPQSPPKIYNHVSYIFFFRLCQLFGIFFTSKCKSTPIHPLYWFFSYTSQCQNM